MRVENINTYNFEGALHGMRNPLESYDKSDSYYDYKLVKDTDPYPTKVFNIGKNDMELAQKLIKAGQDHRKFMRQILVSMDITASMSFWLDMDTYKISTEKNSTSRMHKLASKYCRHLTQEDFNWSHITQFRKIALDHFNNLIDELKDLTDKGYSVMSSEWQKIFEELINDLAEGYLFTRHWTGNYEVLYKMYHARKNHKQREIREFCNVIETLPYAKELIIFE